MKTIQNIKLEDLRSEGIEVKIEGSKQTLVATPRYFSTGSVGYQGVGRIVLDGLSVQASINLVVIGSKPMTTKKK